MVKYYGRSEWESHNNYNLRRTLHRYLDLNGIAIVWFHRFSGTRKLWRDCCQPRRKLSALRAWDIDRMLCQIWVGCGLPWTMFCKSKILISVECIRVAQSHPINTYTNLNGGLGTFGSFDFFLLGPRFLIVPLGVALLDVVSLVLVTLNPSSWKFSEMICKSSASQRGLQ